MRKKNLLFVINNFDIGGPQKSLLSLMYSIDYKENEVDLLILNNKGKLVEHLPKDVNVLKSHDLIEYSLISPNNFLVKTLKNIKKKKFILAFSAVQTVATGIIRKNMTIEKQKHWKRISYKLPKLEKEYDVSFGVSGGHSIMYVADCVKSKKKIGWIRTDYRVLNRSVELDNEYFKKMDRILTVSEMCKDVLADTFPRIKDKFQVFDNLLPFKMYENIYADTTLLEKENELKIVTICRLDPHKGLDLAMGALKILLGKYKNLKWYVVGEGSYREELEREIKKAGLENNFILLGFHFNTAAFLKLADLVVHPSKFEGKSNVVEEAKYLCKPIVATRYNTVADQIIDDFNGIIAELNKESLAKKIDFLIENKPLQDKLCHNLKCDQKNDHKSINEFKELLLV